MQQVINTVLIILTRSMPAHRSGPESSQRKLDMLQYIHRNIYDPDKLKTEVVARHFNISVNYFSEYFRKHHNATLQEYILKYKITLVETRLRYSDMTLSEIAHELNFADQSHLSKVFKKINRMNPTRYRQRHSNPSQVE